MATVKLIEPEDAEGKVKEIYDDITKTRGGDKVNNIWKALANDPDLLEATWTRIKQVMAPGALDSVTKELIYIAVSITNSCEYCIKSHSSAAIKKGASKDMLAELNAVVGMANETNKLVESYQVKVDEIYE